jgi:hypothetical protein
MFERDARFRKALQVTFTFVAFALPDRRVPLYDVVAA